MEFNERPMTATELSNLSVDGIQGANLVKSKRNISPRDKFEIELQKNEKQATKNSLPFARHVAREEFNTAIKSQIDKQLRQYGSIEKPEELKLPIMNWDKYSNLKNFEVIEEHEQPDSHLTKHNPGLSVVVKCITYKFKGYAQTFKVMESGPDAILRAIKKRAKLDQTISKELK